MNEYCSQNGILLTYNQFAVGVGFDGETKRLSPSKNRRPHGDSTPEEDQPITIIASPSDYISVI